MRAFLPAVLFACCAGLADAAPPAIDFPTEVGPENGYVVVQPKTDAVSVVYVALDGVYPIPSAILSDKRTFALPVGGLAEGQYKFMAVAAGKGGEQSTKLLTVTIGKGGGAKPPPPKDGPVEPTGKYYFLVVRSDGPASAAFTKVMSLPEWGQLRAAGHSFKEMTASEAARDEIGVYVDPSQLPAVVTLAVSADRKKSTIARPPVPLPATGAGVLDLPKGVR